jgi:hypothetical protein
MSKTRSKTKTQKNDAPKTEKQPENNGAETNQNNQDNNNTQPK